MNAPRFVARHVWRWGLGACCILGLLLFLSIDGRRPWHTLQLEYRTVQEQELRASLNAEEQRLEPQLDALRQDVASKKTAWAAQQGEVEELQSQRRALDHKLSTALRRAEASRRMYDAVLHRESSETEGLESLRQTMEFDRREVEELTLQVEDRQAKIDLLRADLTIAEAALEVVDGPLEELRRELRQTTLPPWARWPFLTPWVPSLEVVEQRSAVTAKAQPPSVERCRTCHLGVLDDAESSASRRPVLQSHPQPALYLQPDSPHPVESFGCRVCHGGDGRAVGGRRTKARGAAGDPHQGLLPKPLMSSACHACHDGSMPHEVAESSELGLLAEGKRQLEDLGCRNCHGGDVRERSASDLTRLADKTSPRWVFDWLVEPPAGHPVLSANGTQRQVEAQALTETLWHQGRPVRRPASPPGDAEAGAVLFETVGCRGCHPSESGAGVGPHLEARGRPWDSGWVFAWLRQPAEVDPETTMPNLRLSQDEAADLTAFLIRDGEEASAEEELPPLDASLRDRLLFDALAERMTLREAQARVDALGDRQRTLSLGDHLLTSYGCFNCHRGGALSTASPAPELRGLDLASRPQLVQSHVPELAAALSGFLGSDPGGAAGETVRDVAEIAGPRYQLDPDTAEALLVVLLEPPVQIAETYLPKSSPVIERGEQIVTRYGCRSCHSLGGRGGEAFATGDPLQRPPSLDGVGRKLQADWLQSYLEDPGQVTVRPWLRARMPSYGLSPQEVLDLVAFFMERDDAFVLSASTETPLRQDLVVGSLVFEALQCDRCHFATEDSGGFVLEELAPDYRLASQRLRPDWVVQWLIDPQGERERTTMPSFFGDAGQGDLGYLRRTFDSPLFLVHRQGLRRQFNDAEAMDDYLSDHQRVATALRDYVWSLGETSELR